MLEPNKDSFRNLRENLAEIGLAVEDVPVVLQYNKRDLSNILSLEELNAALNPEGKHESFEASAAHGTGVFETLKGISKQTLKVLREKMSQDLKKPTVIAAPAPGMSQATPVLGSPQRPTGAEGSKPGVPAASGFSGPIPKPPGETLAKLARFAELTGATPPPITPISTVSTAKVQALTPEPVFPAPPPPFDMGPARTEVGSREPVSFGESAIAEPKPAPVDSSVKHVRVRSNVDILSELDKLRKASTQKPSGSSGAFPSVPLSAVGLDGSTKSKGGALSLDDILSNAQNHKRELAKSFDVAVPRDTLHHSRSVVVALRFSDEYGGPLLLEKTFSVELSNLKDVQKLLLSLKFNVQGE
jgi:hypothetical protein